MRGGFVLVGSALLPMVGWVLVLPLIAVMGWGISVRSWFVKSESFDRFASGDPGMNTSRRSLLKATALGGGAAVLSSCDQATRQLTQLLGETVPDHLAVPESAEIDPDFHLLSRAAFGPWPGDVQRVKEMGRDAWIEEQLNPDSIPDNACDLRAERFESLYFAPAMRMSFANPCCVMNSRATLCCARSTAGGSSSRSWSSSGPIT